MIGKSLRASILESDYRHSTLSAQMPSESSSVVSNATNGIEPPRDYLSIKKSKKGPLKQVVPSYGSLKNNYTLLWDMPNNDGYINVVLSCRNSLTKQFLVTGVTIQRTILTMRSHVSVMANDLLTTYKYGWKTSYYQNTYDMKNDEVIEKRNPN